MRGKRQFSAISYVWIETFLEEALGLVKVKARLYVNFFALRKYDFLDSFLFCFFFLPTTCTHTHDPHSHPRPTTSTHYPRPTTFSYTQVEVTSGG